MTITGKVKVVDLEGGLVLFDAENSETYQLEGLDSSLSVDGLRLELAGSVAQDAVTIGMSGPLFKVKSAKKL